MLILGGEGSPWISPNEGGRILGRELRRSREIVPHSHMNLLFGLSNNPSAQPQPTQ